MRVDEVIASTSSAYVIDQLSEGTELPEITYFLDPTYGSGSICGNSLQDCPAQWTRGVPMGGALRGEGLADELRAGDYPYTAEIRARASATQPTPKKPDYRAGESLGYQSPPRAFF